MPVWLVTPNPNTMNKQLLDPFFYMHTPKICHILFVLVFPCSITLMLAAALAPSARSLARF